LVGKWLVTRIYTTLRCHWHSPVMSAPPELANDARNWAHWSISQTPTKYSAPESIFRSVV